MARLLIHVDGQTEETFVNDSIGASEDRIWLMRFKRFGMNLHLRKRLTTPRSRLHQNVWNNWCWITKSRYWGPWRFLKSALMPYAGSVHIFESGYPAWRYGRKTGTERFGASVRTVQVRGNWMMVGIRAICSDE